MQITKLPLASSGLREKDILAAEAVLRSGNLTLGSRVKEFESRMADYLGTSHFVMVNSGSSANLVMVEALMRPAKSEPALRAGDGVLVPAVAWPTTIWPIIQLGLQPVFVDIDPNTLAMDPKKVEEKIAASGLQRVRALLPIHPLGFALDHSAFSELAKEFDLVLLADVCESLGSFRNSLHAGASSLAYSLSFYFSHHLTTMEGGGVATDSDEIANDLVSIRSHGWSRSRTDADHWSQGASATEAKFLFVTTGFNVRPMEIQAAIGLSQLENLDEFVSRRRAIAEYVKAELRNDKLSVIDAAANTNSMASAHSWMLLPFAVRNWDKELRDSIAGKLEGKGIETRPILTGNFLAQPSVRKIFGYWPHPNSFPEASKVSSGGFMVGCHHDLTDLQVEYLVSVLNSL